MSYDPMQDTIRRAIKPLPHEARELISRHLYTVTGYICGNCGRLISRRDSRRDGGWATCRYCDPKNTERDTLRSRKRTWNIVD
jgi:hypothetical protein